MPSRPCALVPAAGRSSRMGVPKLLLRHGSTTLIGSLLGALERAGVTDHTVVVRAEASTLRAWLETRRVRVVVNPDPDRGMLSSIQAGLTSLTAEDSARPEPLLVCPADLPLVRPETVRRLLTLFERERPSLAVPTHRGRRGHPLLVAPELLDEIETLDPAQGLRGLLLRYPERLRRLEVDDPGVLRDIDTPQEYLDLTGERLPEPTD